MIRINLLPEEYRRRARTPFKMMAALAGAVAVNASLVAWWCWLAFGVAAEVETERSVLQVEMDGLTPLVKYHEALQSEVGFHSMREEALAQITKDRVLWTKVLDELIDIVHSGGEGVRHYIWFDDLSVKQDEGRSTRPGAQQSYGNLRSSGHSGSAAFNQVAAFLEDFEDPTLSSFSTTFYRPAAPEGTVSASDDGLVPPVNWSFPLSLDLRSPDERFAATNATPPAAAGSNTPAPNGKPQELPK